MTTHPLPIKLSVPEAHLFWEIEVLYEDEHLLAVSKPAGLHATPDREAPRMPHLMGLLHAGIAQAKPFATSRHLSYLASTHRLDPEVSGVLLMAKSKPVLIALANEFSTGKPYLGYVALVAGDLGQAKLTVNAGLIEHPQRPDLQRVDTKKGKMARTELTIAEKFRGYSLLNCRLSTHRHHQVRAHLQHIKLPACGDKPYGGKQLLLSQMKKRYQVKDGKSERPLTTGPALHAERIWFKHPVTGLPLEIRAPWPKELTVAVKYLRRYMANSF
ncbi:MAG: RluA family pseudouridine synthase [Verrucomicrobiales bacterium]|nr:RluA family pseudouridine synthase [Verrucomicrobiales bacterium]